MRKILSCSLPLIVALFGGCARAQVPPTAHAVALTWTAPTSGGVQPYSYIMSRITVASTASTCPPANITTPNYTPLNSASPVKTLTYTDTAASGLTVCYIVQAEDTQNAISNPSSAAGPFVVPTMPGIPGTPNGTVADLKQPPLPRPTEGEDAPVVVAMLNGRVR